MQCCDFHSPSIIVNQSNSVHDSLALIPARYILSVLGSIAMAIIYGLKVNLSVALVAMVNHTAVGHAHEDSDLSDSDVNREVCLAENTTSSSDNQVNILRIIKIAQSHRQSINVNTYLIE